MSSGCNYPVTVKPGITQPLPGQCEVSGAITHTKRCVRILRNQFALALSCSLLLSSVEMCPHTGRQSHSPSQTSLLRLDIKFPRF